MKESTKDKLFYGWIIFAFALWLALVIGGIVVAIHFINKWW
jgi:hypothetical protein